MTDAVARVGERVPVRLGDLRDAERLVEVVDHALGRREPVVARVDRRVGRFGIDDVVDAGSRDGRHANETVVGLCERGVGAVDRFELQGHVRFGHERRALRHGFRAERLDLAVRQRHGDDALAVGLGAPFTERAGHGLVAAPREAGLRRLADAHVLVVDAPAVAEVERFVALARIVAARHADRDAGNRDRHVLKRDGELADLHVARDAQHDGIGRRVARRVRALQDHGVLTIDQQRRVELADQGSAHARCAARQDRRRRVRRVRRANSQQPTREVRIRDRAEDVSRRRDFVVVAW